MQRKVLAGVAVAIMALGPALIASWLDKPKTGAAVVQFVPKPTPTPTPLTVFGIDSAGNMMLLRAGILEVTQGAVGTAGTFSPSCRASANRNGPNAITICFQPDVGRQIRDAWRPGANW